MTVDYNKPITLVRQDFINELTNTINSSGLQPFIIKPILQELLEQVVIAEKQQYERDKLMYEQSIQSQKEMGELNEGTEEA